MSGEAYPAGGAGPEPVEVTPCPSCGSRQAVRPADLGRDVECPLCRAVYRAARPGRSAAPPLPVARRSARRDPDDDPPRRARYEDDDDDDRPRRRRRRSAAAESKRVTAGVLALLLGSFGVHKFYLGYPLAGVLHIVVTIATCGLGKFLAVAEGIIYLTKSDEEFIETYQEGQKEWF